MSIYDPIHSYDLTVLSASRDVFTRVKGADDGLTAAEDEYGWAGIGTPLRDPDDSMTWVCHVACTWLSFNTMVVTGRDGYAALAAAFELVECAVKIHRRTGHEIFFRDYGRRGPQWIPGGDDDELHVPAALFEKIVAAATSTPAPRLRERV